MDDAVRQCAPRRSATAIVWLHLFTAIVATSLAAFLCLITADKVRVFQPGYPSVVLLSFYTPIELSRGFHSIGPVGLIVAAIFCLSASLYSWQRNSRSSTLWCSSILAGHFSFLMLAIFAYAISAVQLAGIAVLALPPADHARPIVTASAAGFTDAVPLLPK